MNFPTNLTRFVGTAQLALKKHSPTILMVVGIGSGIGAAVMACKTTYGLNAKMKPHYEKIEVIKDKEDIDLTTKEMNRELTKEYIRAGKTIVKEYAPALALGSVSVASILASHHILSARNVAITAAYNGVKGAFDDYRKRVVEKFGADTDESLFFGTKKEKIVDADTGEERTVRVPEQPMNRYSPYARFFDNGSKGWSPDSYSRMVFLQAQQREANRRLYQKGWLSLNEVLSMLDIPQDRSAGMIVGWDLNANPNSYVDFGFMDPTNELARDFVNGYEDAILLDFNVDGIILDRTAIR